MPTAKPRFRQHGIRTLDNRPFSEMNITPLIDVLLVLLVMIMLSIPIATHKVEIDLPKAGPASHEPPIINSLRLNAAGVTIWNGKALDREELKSELQAMAKDPAKPQLHFQTDATARFEQFHHVVAMIKRAGVREIGFVGNRQFASWDKPQ